MWSRLFETSLDHHWEAGSRSILLFIGYSANSSGFNAFKYFSGTQDVDPSFHSDCSFHPFVVLLGTFLPFIDLMNLTLIDISFSLELWSVIWRPSSSIYENIYPEILFSVSS